MQAVKAIIGAENAAGVVTLDGRILGDTPAMAALPTDGDCYIGLQPEAPRFYGVTRRLRFAGGRLTDCPPDVTAFDWGGGLYEILLCCGEMPAPRERRFPFVAARCAFEGALAVLYYEDGLWLSIETSGRVETGYLLHEEATKGTLAVSGRTLLAAAQGESGAALALDARFALLGRVEADTAEIEDGALVSLIRLDSQRGYEQRTRWTVEDGRLMPEKTETGFFTREPAPCPPAVRLLEAIMAGREDDAGALLSRRLGVSAAEARGFLGDFAYMRQHPADPRRIGVAAQREALTRLRVLAFETEGDQIVNILEES